MISSKAVLITALLLGAGAAAQTAKTPAQSSAAKSTTTQSTTTTPSSAEPATHHEIGTVSSVTGSELVLSREFKGKTVTTTFMLNSGTKKDGTINRGERVEVSYHNRDNQHLATEVKPETKSS